MITLPITEQSKQQEWKIILTIAQNNGYPAHIIQYLRKKTVNQETETKHHNNRTEQKVDNIHLPQPTNNKGH
jgi:hypothetical protein